MDESTSTGASRGSEEELANPEVTDPTLLYRYSYMVDMVRDAAHALLDVETVSPATIDALWKELESLQRSINRCLSRRLAAEGRQHTLRLRRGEEPGIDFVFARAALLARWIDAVMGEPAFRINRQLAEMNARQVIKQAKAGSGEAAGGMRAGSYL